MSDPLSLSLVDAARAVAKGEVSSVELTEAAMARMAERTTVLDCVVEVHREKALAQARACDEERARGGLRGPLHGVPLAHKDMYYRTGRISGCGSKIRADFVPEVTATALERLDEAGALDIARLHMVEFALGVSGHNEATVTSKNPWNPAHMTGGSSSGSGSAVASGMTFGSLGSDTGGSIRLPSACCGLVGMKPTAGRVSRFAAMPLSHSLDTVGPLTRNVADNALMLRIIAGADARDPTTSRLAVPDFLDGLENGVRGLRVGVPESFFFDDIEPEIETLVRASLEVFRAAGAEVVSVVPPPTIAATGGMTSLIIVVEGAALHHEWLRDRRDDYGRQTWSRFVTGLTVPAARYQQALLAREGILRDFAVSAFETADVLLTPVMVMPVPTLAESDVSANPGFLEYLVRIGRCTRPINYLGLPALNVPCGFSASGLPVSFQLVGRPFDEKTLYRAGRAYERETDWPRIAPFG